MNLSTDTRLEAIRSWLSGLLNTTSFELNPASNDASFRRYFRLKTDSGSFIVMDAPPDKEDTTPFINIATALLKHNINVPEIFAQDTNAGFLLLTDFGNAAYLDKLNHDTADKLYQSAIDSIVDMQVISKESITLPAYSQSKLAEELNLFPDWFLTKHLGLSVPDFLSDTFKLLIENALKQPQVVVHRDYHSRNLMLTTQNSPGIIDFQDAVIGPISYDLVSLLRDCYIEWPSGNIEKWLSYYFQEAQARKLLSPTTLLTEFEKWFDLMGLQRHLKVLGIFCRLNYRDNKANYLNDLPLTLSYVKTVCHKYPELNRLAVFLDKEVKL